MLALLHPADGGHPLRIEKAVSIVGRRQFVCDVYVDDPKISKLHCLIIRMRGMYMIRDMGSANGIRVNGQRVIESAVVDGDEVTFHDHKYRLQIVTDDSYAAFVDDSQMVFGENGAIPAPPPI